MQNGRQEKTNEQWARHILRDHREAAYICWVPSCAGSFICYYLIFRKSQKARSFYPFIDEVHEYIDRWRKVNKSMQAHVTAKWQNQDSIPGQTPTPIFLPLYQTPSQIQMGIHFDEMKALGLNKLSSQGLLPNIKLKMFSRKMEKWSRLAEELSVWCHVIRQCGT